MSKRAVVVVDLQNEYLSSGKLPLVGIGQAVQNAAKVIAAARGSGDLIVHIRHETPAANAPVFTPGSEGVQIISDVAPATGERVIVKNYPNAFRETDLEQILKAQDAQEVVIVGAMSHMCVAATSRAASDLGYKTTVVHDACATMDLEFNGQAVPAAQVHAANMAAIAFAHGAVVSTEELVR
ncbi:cysteine hydrolase family protein [Phenylobacterium sp. Root700]|uniref:cysteine hydrolase family protein n=1 Tax=Phenylobacterium sp. Root700 TaxID=1736591 RepID=UPI0006FFCB65|nr:cysteine hydrolase family protein [Phenylobacterium sp. Root700]KRB49645.1 Isochorismatase [Phenylobacterium sp. Root700]